MPFVPQEIAPVVHLSTVVLQTAPSTNFVLFGNYLVSKVSMVTPKVNICPPFVGKTRILPTRYLFVHRASERHESWRKRMNFVLFKAPRVQLQHPHGRRIFSRQNFELFEPNT